MNNHSDIVGFIWSVADKLRGTYKQSEYGRVILPLVVLRRLDCVLEPTRAEVLAVAKRTEGSPPELRDRLLQKASGHSFYNTSNLAFKQLTRADRDNPAWRGFASLAVADHQAANLVNFMTGFSENAREIMEYFRFERHIERMERADILFQVVQRFTEVDLHPNRVDNHAMGSVFEELIRRFSEQSNETAGEHFTPREVIALMVNLLCSEDDEGLRTKGIIRTLFDPACGTGGMLSVAEERLRELNPDATLEVYGQELNDESYAICRSDMMLKGQKSENISFGNSFTKDGHPHARFHYCISNPPFGVEWKTAQAVVKAEHESRGFAGRFGAGLPRINDGSLLFLQHMISKMKSPDEGGSRIAIVFNGSPLFTGAAGSGESEIRRWIIENDWLEAIIALPDQMFYNTGINTYIWLVTNRKSAARKGTVQLVNGTSFFRKMRKSLGDKRKELGPDDIDTLTRLYGERIEGEHVRVFDNADFGYQRITVERSLRLDFQASAERVARLEDERSWQNLLKSRKKGAAGEAEVAVGRETQAAVRRGLARLDAGKRYLDRAAFRKDLGAAMKAEGVKLSASLRNAIEGALGERNEEAAICRDKKGRVEADASLRDNENVPLTEDIAEYMAREVLPHVPDAWVDESKTKIGYEIPFTRHFYTYEPPRKLEAIEAEIRGLEEEIRGMLAGVLG